MSGRSSEQLDRIASGYRGSQVVLTAVRLGLFEALESDGGLEATELADRLGSDPRATRILCDALLALELVDKAGDRYQNASLAREHLLAEAAGSQVAMLHHAAKLYERWGKLYDAVVEGRPIADEELDPRLAGGPRRFTRAMADVARQSVQATCELLAAHRPRTFLDVGGGPGLYAIEMTRRLPELIATVMDQSEVLEVAADNLRRAGLEGRVVLRPGDAFADDLGGPYDLILLSNLIHIFDPSSNRRLVARCAGSLAAGGRLAIKDFLLDADRRGPAEGLMFAVNMLVSTEAGDCYTAEEVAEWTREAGLEPREVAAVTRRSRLLIARRS